jgi:hypothetical protein
MKSDLKPIAHITVGKNRMKKGHDVFLKNGAEFEIELYNPSQKPVLAKIKINGSYISNTGVVIKPAQRVYLERYIDDAKKFKFETYDVSGSKEEIEHAIKNNGLIQVEFYNELEKFQPFQLITGNGSDMWKSFPPSFPPQDIFYTSNPYDITCNTLGFTSTIGQDVSFTNYNTKSINETGRIEKGSQSEQSFVSVDMSFEYVPCVICEYHILPVSSKPVTVNELNVSYCTGCGLRRRKQNWSFCPKCGTKF